MMITFNATVNDIVNDYLYLFVVILGVFVLVIFGLVISIMVYQKRLNKSTIDSTLKVASRIYYERDSENNNVEVIYFRVYNNNWRDIVISDFGYQYKGLRLSLVDEFINESGDPNNKKNALIIPARQNIIYKLNPSRIEKFIIEHNFNAEGISTISNYVIDSVGYQVLKKNKYLTKILTRRQKARVLLAKQLLHDKELKQYLKEHDNNIPFKEHIYRLLHTRSRNKTKLLKEANEFVGYKLNIDDTENIIKENLKEVQPSYSKKTTIEEEVTSSSIEGTISTNFVKGEEKVVINPETGENVKVTYLSQTLTTEESIVSNTPSEDDIKAEATATTLSTKPEPEVTEEPKVQPVKKPRKKKTTTETK